MSIHHPGKSRIWGTRIEFANTAVLLMGVICWACHGNSIAAADSTKDPGAASSSSESQISTSTQSLSPTTSPTVSPQLAPLPEEPEMMVTGEISILKERGWHHVGSGETAMEAIKLRPFSLLLVYSPECKDCEILIRRIIDSPEISSLPVSKLAIQEEKLSGKLDSMIKEIPMLMLFDQSGRILYSRKGSRTTIDEVQEGITRALLPAGASTSPSTSSTKVAKSPATLVRILSSIPAAGTSEIDPATTAISVTFSEDMAPGFSWTGGGEFMPKVSGRPEWVTSRTCVLPVQLEGGRFYRVGINSTSHKNFRAARGTGYPMGSIWFTTRGASEEQLDALNPPQVLKLEPESGGEAAAGITTITVTFNRQMGSGVSLTGDLGRSLRLVGGPTWNDTRTECSVGVEIKPGAVYRVGLNSPSHQNFASREGVPLQPVTWTFSGRKADSLPASSH